MWGLGDELVDALKFNPAPVPLRAGKRHSSRDGRWLASKVLEARSSSSTMNVRTR
jgi:hypothetical protein